VGGAADHAAGTISPRMRCAGARHSTTSAKPLDRAATRQVFQTGRDPINELVHKSIPWGPMPCRRRCGRVAGVGTGPVRQRVV
jgi:hypothetical protein